MTSTPYDRVLTADGGEVVDFRIDALDRLGIPVTSCSQVVDGVVSHHGNGYGADEESARLSGLGELVEGVLGEQATIEAVRAAVDGSYAELVSRFGDEGVADPRTLCLPAGTDYDADRPLRWVPAERLRTGEAVWLPLEFVASEPAELSAGQGPMPSPALIVPISNGLGAGTDPERPLRHGVLEILQRHTNGLRFRALERRSPTVDPATLPPGLAPLVQRFSDAGIELVVKHAGNAMGVCSVFVTGVDLEPGSPIMVSGCGEAADPVPERAVTKAVLEYANSRTRKSFCFGFDPRIESLAPPAYWRGIRTAGGETRAVEALRAWLDLDVDALRALTASTPTTMIDFASLAEGTAVDPADWSAVTLYDGDVERDALAVTTDRDGAYAAKVVVPGLEVETLSYGRIGEAGCRASLAGGLDLVRVADTASESHHERVVLTVGAEERLGGPVWFSSAVALDIVGPLYPIYREPPRHVLGGVNGR